jgi:hypothetical protein
MYFSGSKGEIFNPGQTSDIDLEHIDLETLSPEEEQELFAWEDAVSFLPAEKIRSINAILGKLTKEEIALRYNPNELNAHDVYPGVWHNDNSPEQAFNLCHLQKDFEKLKELIGKAVKEKDYILRFIG